MSTWKVNRRILFVLFAVWPFASFVVAARNIVQKQYQTIILLFSFLFGYTVYLYSGDITRYEDAFHQVHRYSLSDYFFLITNIFSPEKLNHYTANTVNQQPDIYALTLQFMVSRFTDNPRWFWAIVSLIFTWLFLKFVNEVTPEIKWTKKLPQRVFFAFLLLIIPFYVGVTGVRFWTALFYFMIYAIRFIRSGLKKDLLFSAGAIFIHYSFFFPLVMLILYRYLKISKTLITILILVSTGLFLFSSNSALLGAINQGTSVLGSSNIGYRLNQYSEEDVLVKRAENKAGSNWYVKLRPNAFHFFLIVVFFLDFFGAFRWRSNPFLDRLQPFLIIFFCLALLSFSLGSIGRFKNIFYLAGLTRYVVLCGINPESKSLKILSYILLPILILHVSVISRGGFYYVDPMLIIANPIVLFFVESSESLSEFLVGH